MIIPVGLKASKANTVKKARRVILTLIEIGTAEEIVGAVVNELGNSSPKVPAECLGCLVDAIAAFGLLSLPIKTIIGRMNGLLEDPDKKKKDGAFKLLVEIVKWMGAPSLGFAIHRLDDKQKANLEKKTKDSNPVRTTHRALRENITRY